MFVWSLDMDADNKLIRCAHEFGHFLGLTDGYIRDGELPWLIDFIKNNPKLKGKKTFFFSPLTYLAAPLFSNKERAEDRQKRECTGVTDMMTSSWIIQDRARIPNGTIPQAHVDVVDSVGTGGYKTQDLCWRPGLFE